MTEVSIAGKEIISRIVFICKDNFEQDILEIFIFILIQLSMKIKSPFSNYNCL
jgi:hypothetical protein